MKKLVLVLVLLGAMVTPAIAEWDFSLIAEGSYDQGTWERSPDGAHKDGVLSWGIIGQIKTDVLNLPWDLESLLRISYQQRSYDFSNEQAPVQKVEPRIYSAFIGVNKGFKGGWNVHAAIGMSYIDFNLKMVELVNGMPYPHSGTPTGTFFAIDLGVNKLFRVWKHVYIGPEIGVVIYPERPGFHRCRDFEMGYLQPYGGLAIQF